MQVIFGSISTLPKRIIFGNRLKGGGLEIPSTHMGDANGIHIVVRLALRRFY